VEGQRVGEGCCQLGHLIKVLNESRKEEEGEKRFSRKKLPGRRR
jgi:hypothetical protein